jgi:hypothetical protein
MSHKNGKNTSDRNAALASLKSEMAWPRIAKSAKIAERNLDTTRVPEQPSASMSGRVDKIIPEQNPSQPERVDISIEQGHQPSQFLRVENSLTDENGDEVRLKKGAHVDITVTDETKAAKRNSRLSRHQLHAPEKSD